MNNNTFVHKYLKTLISKDSIAVDMTTGNGNDTYFLCKLAKKVYGFDIQKEAIENTKNKTQRNYQQLKKKVNYHNLRKFRRFSIRQNKITGYFSL